MYRPVHGEAAAFNPKAVAPATAVKTMLTSRPLTLVAMVLSGCAYAYAEPGKPEHNYRSPDGKLIATVIAVNKVHESRVEVRNAEGRLLLLKDYSSPDLEHGQKVLKAAWTPDGEFFVFSTLNTGGHSPLARPTFFYSRAQNRIYELGVSVGYITEWDFKLEAPNWVITKRLDQESGESETARVALSTLVK